MLLKWLFYHGIPVNKIPHCGIVVISNPAVFDVGAFKPTVLGETKLFAVLRHQQNRHRTVYMRTTRYGQWLCDVFVGRKTIEAMTLIVLPAKYYITCGRFPFSKSHIEHVNHESLKYILRFRCFVNFSCGDAVCLLIFFVYIPFHTLKCIFSFFFSFFF